MGMIFTDDDTDDDDGTDDGTGDGTGGGTDDGTGDGTDDGTGGTTDCCLEHVHNSTCVLPDALHHSHLVDAPPPATLNYDPPDDSNTGCTHPVNVSAVPICVPQYRPCDRWQIRRLSDTYTGPDGTGVEVPNVGDLIVDTDTGATYKVITVDAVVDGTFLYTKTPFQFGALQRDPTVPPDNFLSDPHRVYIDYSKTPSVMLVDPLALAAGEHLAYAKIFDGGEIYNESSCISLIYADDGQVTSNRIPLTVVALDSHENHHIKTIDPCNVSRDIQSGDLLTVVYYTAEGVVARKTSVIAELVAYIGDVFGDSTFVTNVELVSPWLSDLEHDTLLVPMGTSYDDLHITANIHYRSGLIKPITVAGNKLWVSGVESYELYQQPRMINMGLRYTVLYEESAIDTICDKFIVKPFVIKIIDLVITPGMALMPVLLWSGAGERFDLKWWLVLSDGGFSADVTEYVTTYDAQPFVGNQYEVRQAINVSVNTLTIPDLDGEEIVSQSVLIELFNPASLGDADWSISNMRDLVGPPNASELYIAANVDGGTGSAIRGATSVANFMALSFEKIPKLYLHGTPLDLTPTHLRLSTPDGTLKTVPITNYNGTHNLGALVSGDTVIVEFCLLATTATFRVLGVSSLMIR